MPRQARRLPYSGYSHVIVRGIGKQVLFEERQDYRCYLSCLKKYSEEQEVAVCAYCLMNNHVHLLLYDKDQHVSQLMKKLGVAYSRYFNAKYERIGHLFQDRFLSEAVEDEGYLLGVFRYILNNPWKAGICSAADYEWSSYRDYGKKDSFVDPGVIRERIGDVSQLAGFMAVEEEREYMEYQGVKHDDRWAEEVIRDLFHGQSGTVLQRMDARTRNIYLKKLKSAGLSVRQMERLTGINRGVIQRLA